jgi:effector-binding domain-containing protein
MHYYWQFGQLTNFDYIRMLLFLSKNRTNYPYSIMKALKIIFFVLIGLVVVVAALSFATATDMRSERSVVINAPKAVIFEQVRMLANAQKWSPWSEKDPNMKTSLAGTDGTVGAIFSWDSKDVGKGEQTIAKIEDQKRVDIKLHFIEPFESNANSYITLEDDPNGVKVSWGFEGSTPRPWNVLGLFMNMEKAIGEDFSKGLEKLKVLAEKEAASMPLFEVKESTVEPRTYYGIRKEVTFDHIKQVFNDLFTDAGKAGIKPSGSPVGLYYKWDDKGMKTDMAAAIPVANVKGNVGPLQKFDIKGGKALTIDYYGAYEKLGDAHNAMDKYIAQKQYKMLSPVMEEYVTDPMSEPDASKWLTRIIYFVE